MDWKYAIGDWVKPLADPRHLPMLIIGRACDECPGAGVQRKYIVRGRASHGGFTNELIHLNEMELVACEPPKPASWADFKIRDKADVELLREAAAILLTEVGSGKAEAWLKRYHEHTTQEKA